MQNLRYYCRQRIEALVDKQSKFGLDLNILLFRVQIKSYTIHFQIIKVTEMKDLYVKETYIFFYNTKEMSKFCKSVKL